MSATTYDVIHALIRSTRWEYNICDLPVTAIAAAPMMRPDNWTQEERDQAIAWADGRSDLMPQPIADYLQRVREYIQ